MKKRLTVALCALAVLLAGCGSKPAEAKEDTIFVSKKGDIRAYIQSEFAESYYDESELERFIQNSVDDYIAVGGEGTVTIEEYKVENGVASLMLSYASVTDYADFNGVEFYAGGVIAAQAAGYQFEGDYLAAENGVIGTERVKGSAFMDDEAYKCVIVGQATCVDVSGDIVYVSEGNVELLSARTARVAFDNLDVDAQAGCIIYKK